LIGVAVSPDGKTVAAGGEDHRIAFYDLATGKERTAAEPHRGGIWALAFTRDGKQLLTGDSDALRLWDVATGKEVRRFGGDSGNAASAVLSPDGKRLATTHGKAVAVWDVATGKELCRRDGPENSFWWPAFLPGDRLLAAGGVEERLRVWDVM